MVDSRSFIQAVVAVEIDRPLGSKHPRHGFIYPVNYGFVPGVLAPDGEYLDAYVLGIFEPVSRFEGRCIAVLQRLNDEDDKLIVVPEGRTYSDEQIQALVEFQERYFVSVIIRSCDDTTNQG